jgi:molecular chaperone HtpG
MSRLLEPLRPQLRRDLALVCESHHLDDLYDLKKYKVSQPYGNSDSETANVQYASVLLRAADLLNVTSDRTPSVVFRVINPVDPISQQEWAKQMAVTRVRSKVGVDQEGNPDEKVPRDTIEVYAYFTSEDGFFGLTSYLKYAADQLRKCYDWVEMARKSQGVRHEFPWRSIDDNNIETEGFLRDTFEFTIDQAKILDLLTGHTLP